MCNKDYYLYFWFSVYQIDNFTSTMSQIGRLSLHSSSKHCAINYTEACGACNVNISTVNLKKWRV